MCEPLGNIANPTGGGGSQFLFYLCAGKEVGALFSVKGTSVKQSLGLPGSSAWLCFDSWRLGQISYTWC